MVAQSTKFVVASPSLTHSEQLNIFAFDEPDRMHCKVWEYQYSQSVLIIEIANEDDSQLYELTFTMVHHLSAIKQWQGANFRLMPFDTSLRFAVKHNIFGTNFEGYPPEVIARTLDLAKVYHLTPTNNPDQTITICAAMAGLRSKNR